MERSLYQGVRESHRSKKIMCRFKAEYAPQLTKKKNPINLLKLSIPDISTSMSTIFSIENLDKLCQSMLILAST